MKVREEMAVRPSAMNAQLATTCVLPLVMATVVLTAANQQFGWLKSSADVNISPSLLLDIIAILLTIVVVQVLRSTHRATNDPRNVRVASVVMLAGSSVALSAASSALGSDWLQAAHLISGWALAALVVHALSRSTSPLVFRIAALRSIGTFAIAAVPVGMLLTATELHSFSAPLSASTSAAIALSGLTMTVVGLRRKSVDHQILGLTVLSAASLGSSVSLAESDVLLVQRATFALLLSTLAIHGLVELRNMSISAQSTVVRTTADLDASYGLLKQQREERAQLIHDSRNALLVIQAGLQSVANDESAALISSLNSELTRIQAMIERNHTPIEPIDVLDTLAPMVRCYHSGGLLLDLRAYEDTQPYAMASRTQLVEVMQNLVENAIRHAASDQPIEISVREFDEFVQIDVRDHGAGIDLRDRIQVAQRVGSLSGIGTGRGLSICQRMVSSMDGELEYFTPDIGAGTVFRVRLPTISVLSDKTTLTERAAV